VLQRMIRNSDRSWVAYAAIFTLALGLRLGYEAFVWNGTLGNADTPTYQDLAAKIVLGEPYYTNQRAGPGGFPADLQRPPGYPAFLAAINFNASDANSISRLRTSIVQGIVGAAFAASLAWFVAAMTSPGIGLLAGCFYAVDWVTIVHTPMVVSETVYTVLLGASVLVFAAALLRNRVPLFLLAGFLLGVAALVKPAAQVVLVAFLIGWLCHQPRRWPSLLFLLSYMACVLPWMTRNQTKYGVFSLSEIGTVDLYFYNAQGSLHSYSLSDLKGDQINGDVTALDRTWESQSLTPQERSRQMKRQAVALIISHWPAVLWQSMVGLARTSLGTASVTAADAMNTPPSRLLRILLNVLPLAQISLLWALAIYGCFARQALPWETRVLLVATVLCILLPAASPLAQSRFRVPAIPEICVLAAAGVISFGVRYGGWNYRSALR
jgi:hypothetical protein